MTSPFVVPSQYIDEKLLTEWVAEMALPFAIRFRPGPYVYEFGHGDSVGTVTTVSGRGTLRNDLWDTHSFQIRIDHRDRDQAEARAAIWCAPTSSRQQSRTR